MFDAQQVADRLRISRSMVYKLMGTGELTYQQFGDRRVITQVDLDDYLRRTRRVARSSQPETAALR